MLYPLKDVAFMGVPEYLAQLACHNDDLVIAGTAPENIRLILTGYIMCLYDAGRLTVGDKEFLLEDIGANN